MKADPLKSEGARMERAAFRAYLRRKIKTAGYGWNACLTSGHGWNACLNEVLGWVLSRQKRYDKTKGGLGRQ